MAELEAEEIRKFYAEAAVFVRDAATEKTVRALSPTHDVLHFATHAELSKEDPLSSAILLTKAGNDDGALEVREIFGMNLNASLVVSSGCETGLGKLSSGDELVGLTRAFIYAGTPSVVASFVEGGRYFDRGADGQLLSKSQDRVEDGGVAPSATGNDPWRCKQ